MKLDRKARELKRNCKETEKCGGCDKETREVCYDLCEYSDERLCDLDTKTIVTYLRSFKGYSDDI